MAASDSRAKKDSRKEKKEPGKFARFFRRLGRFFADLRAELKRVIWPDRKKWISSTVIVLAICVAAGIFLWIVDSLLMGFLNAVGFYSAKADTPAPTTPLPAVTTVVPTPAATTTIATTTLAL